jgi:hypothetical protein
MASLRSIHRLVLQPRVGFYSKYNRHTSKLFDYTSSIRSYTPFTQQELETEKQRVAGLTPFQKDQEVRQLNRDISKYETLKGVNTGELYTWSGKYKALARDYGMPLMVWYWAVWTSSFAVCYGAINVGGVDPMAVMSQIDTRFGWDLATRIDPEMGKIGMALVVNELAEPLRLPVVIMTVKPVMDNFFPPKY